jgi:hypothetical protein
MFGSAIIDIAIGIIFIFLLVSVIASTINEIILPGSAFLVRHAQQDHGGPFDRQTARKESGGSVKGQHPAIKGHIEAD